MNIHDAVNKHGSEIDTQRSTGFLMSFTMSDGPGSIGTIAEDDSITGIMVNGPEQIYIERNGKLCLPM